MALVLVQTAWLAACAEPVPPASGAAAEVARAAAAEPYPQLARVPPRPKLGYTVEQRRAIVRGLIADREQTRYEGETLRHRLLGTNAPTPPAMPQAEAPAAAEPAPVIVEAAVLGESVRTESRSGSLSDFLDWLLQPTADGGMSEVPQPDAGSEQTVGQAAVPSPQLRADATTFAANLPAPVPAKAASDAVQPERLFGPAEPADALTSSLAQPSMVEFVLVANSLPPQVRREMQALVAAPENSQFVVIAQGEGPAQSLERARWVARELVALGVDPRHITLRPSGPGQRVRVERRQSATISAQAGTPRVGHPQE